MRRRVLIPVLAVVAAASIAGGAVAVASSGGDEGSVTGPEADRATEAALAATKGGTANAVERDNENGATWEVEVTKPDGKTVDVRLDDTFGVVVIEGDSEKADDNSDDNGNENEQAGATEADDHDDEEASVTGSDADRATAAALAATNGGTANSVERDSEKGATWEVEVTKPDGATVDVRLDDKFGVVVIENDSERPDAGNDD